MMKSVETNSPAGGASEWQRAQATAITFVMYGLEAQRIQVEVDVSTGAAAFRIAGLSDVSVRETRVRVRAAMQSVGVNMAELAISVNLTPLDLPKSGGAFDMAIAVAILAALGKIPADKAQGTAFLGELSLTGGLRPVRGVLPALLGAGLQGTKKAIVPLANAGEAAYAQGMSVSATDHLRSIIDHFKDGSTLEQLGDPAWDLKADVEGIDFADVRGHYAARRAFEVAAAGGHHLILIGPPGSGKTMLARRLPTILPPLTRIEALEVMSVFSVAGLLRDDAPMIRTRPFRAPHHTVSAAGLVGGGDMLRPGELSLAHLGCLFLDDLVEFRRTTLEALHWPLAEGVVTLRRRELRSDFPARPLVVAAVNPCPCGFAGCSSRRCSCTPERVQAYRKRLSGPLFERIDIDVVLSAVDVRTLSSTPRGETSAAIRQRVAEARAIQMARYESGEVSTTTNARLGADELERVAKPDDEGARVLTAALDRLQLSSGACCKILRVARTIADLDGSVPVRALHISEAIASRMLDRPAGENGPSAGTA